MTNEMKLLMAFIEAGGYEVEEIIEGRLPSGQIIVPHDYKVTKKVSFQKSDLSADIDALRENNSMFDLAWINEGNHDFGESIL